MGQGDVDKRALSRDGKIIKKIFFFKMLSRSDGISQVKTKIVQSVCPRALLLLFLFGPLPASPGPASTYLSCLSIGDSSLPPNPPPPHNLLQPAGRCEALLLSTSLRPEREGKVGGQRTGAGKLGGPGWRWRAVWVELARTLCCLATGRFFW